MSISSTNKRSASGWCQAFTTCPTRTSSLENNGWSACWAAGAAALGLGLVLALPFGAAAAWSASLGAGAFSTPSCSKRIDPVLTSLPAERFRKESDSCGMGFGGVPSFWKTASAAVGMKGAKKCASTYTASRSIRKQAARIACFSPFIFHGSRSAIHLFVAPQARTVRSAASESLKPSKASRTEVFSAARAKGGDTRAGSHSGTLPPQSVAARLTRFPRLSQSSALCMSFRESSLNFTSSP
mmetsp:Transcript_92134/g.256696  ORF Transcript_92134/g.256696 Transcript_92134/m.256696 type:complete len:241 (+) Transcript_92134:541-1263(+)